MGLSFSHMPKEDHVNNGVFVAHELLHQLQTGQVIQPHTLDPEILARQPAVIEQEAAALIQRDVEVQAALQASQRVNELLVKHHKEEVNNIQKLAQELIAREYEQPSHPVPCTQEESACVQCYKENPDNPTTCADVVATYSACTQRAFDAFVARTAAAG